ncbi:transcriptional regulator [Nocardiopsis terrae]|uniref:Transcriptional regulator with XRE-family HTH domain n=1 Tax=Nocardiopsis terrae TaxID=372655 RepID=A0ABR9HNF2_9ACTN|nr:helix-turn-helix transcriptional regulator [Nocardiopsis terrae]MBE1460555.1 transcriptional regulator with XRE-family HTH domain [Nocardiopsis terrae]GHC72074.1 transcriptional regulator [Nocardiopsis terrae]
MTDRPELAAFLRSRRARLLPSDVGLPGTGRRRTPGLRRQEVAQLAGMSVEYYVRLEQARGPRPSAQVLSALSRALMLSADERAYLFRVAGEEPQPVRGPDRRVSQAIRHLLDSLTATPAYVLDAKYDVLAWNTLATHFIGDMSAVEDTERNIITWMFRLPDDDPRVTGQAGTDCMERHSVADLRAAYARYPGDPGIGRMVTTLLGSSSRFARLWEERDVQERRGFHKRVGHPLVGPLEFECQVLHVPESDQRVMLYCAEPGSPSEEGMRRLAADHAPPGAGDFPGGAHNARLARRKG